VEKTAQKFWKQLMILLLDTSTNICKISLIDGQSRIDDEWQSDRSLAKDLLKHLHELLLKNNYDWSGIQSIGVLKGPGSFTGLRIGITVANTLADGIGIPIVGSDGDDWQTAALKRLENGENDKIVLPSYGSDAKITTPKK
jgi:tRNA threonylcarbamoyl adenosine modification protein YeaZ